MGLLRDILEDYVPADAADRLKSKIGWDWKELDGKAGSFVMTKGSQGLYYVPPMSHVASAVRVYAFYDGKRAVAACTMSYNRDASMWEISFSQSREEGKGYGMRMYLTLLKDEGLTLLTAGLLTPGSAKLWAALYKREDVEVTGRVQSMKRLSSEAIPIRIGEDGKLHSVDDMTSDRRLALVARYRG